MSNSRKINRPPKREIKMFRPVSWHGNLGCEWGDAYLSHILLEIGRLGMSISNIECHSRPPHTQTVLSDVLGWISGKSDKSLGLFDIKHINIEQMGRRLREDRQAKPRIELSAHITKMNNLSVRWHPGGWSAASPNWGASTSDYYNIIPRMDWASPPDFSYFTGDEEITFDSRPSNELMYIRGVGNLNPSPIEDYGQFAEFNHDVVDSILICIVRSAYESLGIRLRHAFDVDIKDVFQFETIVEIDEETIPNFNREIDRVTSWSLEDSMAVMHKKQKIEENRIEELARNELDIFEKTHGLSLQTFVDALSASYGDKNSGAIQDHNAANKYLAKSLRNAGHKVSLSDVRRIRAHIEKYRRDLISSDMIIINRYKTIVDDNVIPFKTSN